MNGKEKWETGGRPFFLHAYTSVRQTRVCVCLTDPSSHSLPKWCEQSLFFLQHIFLLLSHWFNISAFIFLSFSKQLWFKAACSPCCASSKKSVSVFLMKLSIAIADAPLFSHAAESMNYMLCVRLCVVLCYVLCFVVSFVSCCCFSFFFSST